LMSETCLENQAVSKCVRVTPLKKNAMGFYLSA